MNTRAKEIPVYYTRISLHYCMENKFFCYKAARTVVAPSSIIARPTEAEQVNQGFSDNTAIAPCPRCGNCRLKIVFQDASHPHFAASVCADCDRFLRWLPNPATEQKRQQQRKTISRLLRFSQLTEWERGFLEGLEGKRSLSPKQQEILARIEAKVGGHR